MGWIALIVLPIWALHEVFISAPNERTMGVVQRIFYFHVSSAAAAFVSFLLVAVAGVFYLVTGRRRWDRLALSASEVGVAFLTIVIVTGPLWARPVWGRYWVWEDARLITTLVLWIYFTIYLLLRRGWQDNPQGLRFAAVIGIVGFLDVPIIYFSVRWWNYIHPSHVVGPIGGGLDPAMRSALMVSFVAILAVWLGLLLQRLRLEAARDEVRDLARRLAGERV
jgi:heme exporter protein C